MSAIITSDSQTETRYYVRRVQFENVAPILLERNYSHGGKEFLPTTASARWEHGHDIKSIKVSGKVLKKDRTTGNQSADIDYCTPASHHWGKSTWQPQAPEWLLELFDIEVPNNETSN